MLKKLQLDLTKAYEICIATEKIAQMLVAFVQGRAHTLTVGCEQGDIAKWDDLILELSDGTLEHIQVKRNFTDFSDFDCDRASDPISHGKNAGALRKLSPFDETIKALADWTTSNDPGSSTPKRKFMIEVPSMSTLVKKDLEVRHVYDFCRSISPSTTAASLATVATTHAPTKNIYKWLTTWCDFQDWDHILKAFRHIDIVHVGTETEIENRTEDHLALCFSNTQDVRKQIHLFIDENSTYTSAITPRPLFGQLKAYWLPGLAAWTQYLNHGPNWDISGTNDHDFDKVEKPNCVVDGMWETERPNVIKIHCDSPKDEPFPTAIRRMVLHLPRPAMAHVKNADIWKERVLNFIGGTIGLSEEDGNDLAVAEFTDIHQSSDNRLVTKRNDADSEAQLLTDQMNLINWKLVVEKVDLKISSIPASDLRTAVEQRWAAWKLKLDSDVAEQVKLCQLMLHPKAEGEDIISIMRVGPKTALLIAKGMVLLLAVGVAISDTDEGWECMGSGLSVGTKALIYWSGPSGKTKSVRLLTDEGIGDLIGKEVAKILILSGVEESGTDIKETSLAESSGNNFNLATGHQQVLLITHSMKLRQLIIKGDLNGLKLYVQQEIAKVTQAKTNQIKTIMS